MTRIPALELTRVTRDFGAGRLAVRAVDDVSLSVEVGELLVLMGPSGSGKSTLLQLMGAMLSPTRGEVRLDGRLLSGIEASALGRIRLTEIGFVFQAFNLLASLSALDNVALPATLAGRTRSEARELAAAQLERLGLSRRLGHLPEQLSGGEKQRVAIARALVNDPPVVLADEPTANLDAASGLQALHLLEDVATRDHRTVVIVTHDHRVLEVADRVLWLADGTLSDRKAEFSLATDPVCGMEVIVERAATTRGSGDGLQVFCSERCAQRFDLSAESVEGRR